MGLVDLLIMGEPGSLADYFVRVPPLSSPYWLYQRLLMLRNLGIFQFAEMVLEAIEGYMEEILDHENEGYMFIRDSDGVYTSVEKFVNEKLRPLQRVVVQYMSHFPVPAPHEPGVNDDQFVDSSDGETDEETGEESSDED